jgi:glutathione S-transferase
MRLIQIPFSHNCIKARRALELKGLAYETLDISPLDRAPVVAASGQALVPVLQDGGRSVVDSTEILRHLERTHPTPSLLPEDPARHAACWLIEDWADRALMARTRRMAYWYRLSETPDLLARRFFPGARGLKLRVLQRVMRRKLIRRFDLSEERNAQDERELPVVASLALERLGGRPRFFAERTTVADVGLAAMAAPLLAVGDRWRRHETVGGLLRWAEPILGEDVLRLYARDGAAT